jgi:hypothetical protein
MLKRSLRLKLLISGVRKVPISNKSIKRTSGQLEVFVKIREAKLAACYT